MLIILFFIYWRANLYVDNKVNNALTQGSQQTLQNIAYSATQEEVKYSMNLCLEANPDGTCKVDHLADVTCTANPVVKEEEPDADAS